MTAYIAGGDTRTFRVPEGTYSIYFAQGQVWCGFRDAFGKGNTKLMELSGEFAFTSTVVPGVGTNYEGEEIDVTPKLEGNLRSHEVSDADFSDLVPAGPATPSNENK
ncbi:hypothetical protein [Rhodanobacter sp. B05]|uniref:hypothetical protein n=1 Tax=Rhodanobacter sp. B05 TaxID=1945859 RepID=UPI0011157368|nr:hypothetical protein [Rhodanobacter sp. B05]